MNCSRHGRLFCSIVAIALFISCAALNPSVKKGDELWSQGRWYEAMLEYESAAEASPRSSSVQEKLEAAQAKVIGDLVLAIDQAIEIRRLDQAEQYLRDAMEIDLDSRQVLDARRKIAGAWAAEAEAILEEDGDVDRAFRAVDRASEIDADAPGVRSARNKIRTEYAKSLREEADSYESEGRAAPALVALVRLSDVERPNLATQERMSGLRSWMHSQAGYVVELSRIQSIRRQTRQASEILDRFLALPPPEDCPNLHITQRAIEGPGSILSATLTHHSFDRDQHQRSEPHEFQTGTRKIPNPEWPKAAADLESAQRDLEASVEQVRGLSQQVARCEVAVVEAGPGDDVDHLRGQLEDARRDLEAAQQDAQATNLHLAETREIFESTPEELDEPVMELADLLINTVVRTFRLETTLGAQDMTTGRVAWNNRVFAAESKAEGEHHRGLSAADIPPKTLEMPMTDEELRDNAIQQILEEIREDIAGLCRDHRDSMRQFGIARLAENDIATATEWFVLALFFNPEADLDAWDRDGQVQRFFERYWQLEDPKLLLGQ